MTHVGPNWPPIEPHTMTPKKQLTGGGGGRRLSNFGHQDWQQESVFFCKLKNVITLSVADSVITRIIILLLLLVLLHVVLLSVSVNLSKRAPKTVVW